MRRVLRLFLLRLPAARKCEDHTNREKCERGSLDGTFHERDFPSEYASSKAGVFCTVPFASAPVP